MFDRIFTMSFHSQAVKEGDGRFDWLPIRLNPNMIGFFFCFPFPTELRRFVDLSTSASMLSHGLVCCTSLWLTWPCILSGIEAETKT